MAMMAEGNTTVFGWVCTHPVCRRTGHVFAKRGPAVGHMNKHLREGYSRARLEFASGTTSVSADGAAGGQLQADIASFAEVVRPRILDTVVEDAGNFDDGGHVSDAATASHDVIALPQDRERQREDAYIARYKGILTSALKRPAIRHPSPLARLAPITGVLREYRRAVSETGNPFYPFETRFQFSVARLLYTLYASKAKETAFLDWCREWFPNECVPTVDGLRRHIALLPYMVSCEG